jgi:hypothetical protein
MKRAQGTVTELFGQRVRENGGVDGTTRFDEPIIGF